jgi:hypothetical protein
MSHRERGKQPVEAVPGRNTLPPGSDLRGPNQPPGRPGRFVLY